MKRDSGGTKEEEEELRKGEAAAAAAREAVQGCWSVMSSGRVYRDAGGPLEIPDDQAGAFKAVAEHYA